MENNLQNDMQAVNLTGDGWKAEALKWQALYHEQSSMMLRMENMQDHFEYLNEQLFNMLVTAVFAPEKEEEWVKEAKRIMQGYESRFLDVQVNGPKKVFRPLDRRLGVPTVWPDAVVDDMHKTWLEKKDVRGERELLMAIGAAAIRGMYKETSVPVLFGKDLQ